MSIFVDGKRPQKSGKQSVSLSHPLSSGWYPQNGGHFATPKLKHTASLRVQVDTIVLPWGESKQNGGGGLAFFLHGCEFLRLSETILHLSPSLLFALKLRCIMPLFVHFLHFDGTVAEHPFLSFDLFAPRTSPKPDSSVGSQPAAIFRPAQISPTPDLDPPPRCGSPTDIFLFDVFGTPGGGVGPPPWGGARPSEAPRVGGHLRSANDYFGPKVGRQIVDPNSGAGVR